MAKEEIKEKWAVEDVPTQTAPMVINLEEKQAYPMEVAIAKILNKLEKMEKALSG